MFRKTLLAAIIGCTGLMLAGCTDKNDDEQNDNPVIILASEVTVAEKQTLLIEADVIDDGQVSLHWQQLSGPTLQLQGDTTAAVGVSVPATDKPEEAVLQLTAIDSEGLVDSAQVKVIITQNIITLPIEGRIYTGLETEGKPENDILPPPPVDMPATGNITISEGGMVESEHAKATSISSNNTTDNSLDSQPFEADLEYNDFQVKVYLGDRDTAELASTAVLPDGTYRLAIKVDDDEAITVSSEPLLLEATFANGKGVMQSQLLPFNELQQLIESGDISPETYWSFNISPFSTVHRALLARANQYQEIDSEEKKRLLQLQLNMNDLANYTSAYTSLLNYGIVVDNPDINLPSEYEDSISFLYDDSAFNYYKNTAWWERGVFEYTTQLNLQDSQKRNMLTLGFSDDLGIYANFDLVNGKVDSFFLSSETNSTQYIDDFTWSKEGQTYYINNEEGLFNSTGTETVTNDSGESVEVTFNQYFSDIQIRLLHSFEDSTVVYFTAIKHKTYPNNEKDDFEINFSWYSDIYEHDKFSVIKPLKGSTWTLPTPGLNLRYWRGEARAFEFTDDSVGWLHRESLEPVAFNWSYDESNQLLINIPELNTELVYSAVSADLSVQGYYVESTYSETDEKAYNVGFAGELTKEQQFTSENAVGIYGYLGDGKSLNEFWIEVHENGDAYRVDTNDYNNDGQLNDEEIQVHVGQWQIDEGVLSVLFFQDPTCKEVGCPAVQARKIQSFQRVDNRVYMHNEINYDWNESTQSFDSVLFDNRAYDVTNERPIAKEHLSSVLGTKLPHRLPGEKIEGLLPITSYLDKPLYHADHDYWYEQETGFLQLNSDESYTRFSHGETADGQYQIDQSNQVFLPEPNTTSGYYNYGFLAESDNVVLGAFIGLPWPHFYEEQSAKDYAKRVFDMTHTQPFYDYYDQAIFMADRDSSAVWQVTPLMMNENSITVYSDSAMTQVAKVFTKDVDGEDGYTLTDDGRILFNDGNSLYIPLATSDFASVVTDDVENNSRDFNYFFFDFEQAETFVKAINELRSSMD